MDIQKAKYNDVLESIVATNTSTAGEIRNAAITILVASLFKYDKLTHDAFNDKNIDLELLNPVRILINKINELYPIDVDNVINNATVLIIKTARSTFGCPYAIALGYNSFAQTYLSNIIDISDWNILKDATLIDAIGYTNKLISHMESNDVILVSNEGCQCISRNS